MPDFAKKLRRESRPLLLAQSIGSLLAGFLAWSGLLILLDLYDAYSPIQETDAGTWILTTGIVVGGCSLLFLGYVWLNRPTSRELAQKVELAHPELKDLLNSAVEIEQKGQGPKFMEKRVLRELSRQAASLDWTSVLRPTASLRKYLIMGFFIGIALSVWNFNRNPLVKARAFFGEQPGLEVRTSLSGAPEIHWNLGDAEYRRGTDVSIHAEILRDYRESQDAWVEWMDGNQTTTLKMLSKQKSAWLEWVIPGLDQSFRYRVVTASLQSDWFQIEPYDPPEIEFVHWEITPPAYLKMPPILHNELGYIKAPENSTVRLDVRVKDFPKNISTRLLGVENNVTLEKTGRITFSWQGQLEHEFSAKIGLTDLDHPDRPEILSDEVVISPIPDQPPLIEIKEPGKDLQLPFDADPQLIEVFATDDHGVAEIGLWVYHNDVEKELDLFVDPIAKEKAVTGILDLSEFPLADVDVVTYMAFAGDTREPGNQISESDIYFIEIGHSAKKEESAPPSDAMGQEMWEIPIRKFINLNREIIRKLKNTMSLEGIEKTEQTIQICADALSLKNLMTIVYDDHGKSFPIDGGLDTGELFLESIYDIEQVEISSGDGDVPQAFKAALRTDRKLVQIWGLISQNKPPEAPGQMKPNPLNRKELLKSLEAFQKKLQLSTQPNSGADD